MPLDKFDRVCEGALRLKVNERSDQIVNLAIAAGGVVSKKGNKSLKETLDTLSKLLE